MINFESERKIRKEIIQLPTGVAVFHKNMQFLRKSQNLIFISLLQEMCM